MPKPVKTFALNFVEAAVWENTRDGGKTRFKVTLSRSYRDSDGTWKRTESLDPSDIPYAQLVLQDALRWEAEERHRRATERKEAAEAET